MRKQKIQTEKRKRNKARTRQPGAQTNPKCQSVSVDQLHLFVVKDLYTLGVFANVGDEGLVDLVAFAAGDAENEVVQ